MKIHSLALTGCLSGIVLAGLASCSSPPARNPSLTPVMANPQPAPVPVVVTEPAAMVAIPATALPAPTARMPEATGGSSLDGFTSVPGAEDPWFELRDYSFDRRDEFVSRAQTSISLLNGAVSVARQSLPKPGLTDAHAAAISNLDAALTTLEQDRAALTFASADRWEGAKNDFHAAWLNARAACARARATGS